MKDEVSPFNRFVERYKDSVYVQVTGIGKSQVLSAAESIFRDYDPPTLVLSIGFCGALSDELKTGDLILARKLYLFDSDDALVVDNRYYQLAEQSILENRLPYVRRDSLTVPKMIRTPEEKNNLALSYHAQAVNMEDYWICSIAAQSGVPFLSVRAIVDTANQQIPEYVEDLMWQRERRHVIHNLCSFLSKPVRIPQLLSFSHSVKKAQNSLNRFTRSFITKSVSSGRFKPT